MSNTFQAELFKSFQKAQQKKYKNPSSILTGLDEIPAVEVIPIGDPLVDRLLAGTSPEGGIIRAGIVEISGGFSSGKTTLSLEWMAKVMKMFPDRGAAFIDAEHAFDEQYARHIGVPTDSERFVYSSPKGGQEACTLVRDLANTGMFSMIIVDSWAALLPPRQENSETIGNHSIGDLARLTSAALPAISAAAKHNDCTVIILNQERVNMTPMGARGKKTTGGNAMGFYSDMRLSINKVKKDSDDRVLQVTKAKSQALPWTETTITIKHGVGLDRLESLISLAIADGFITTGGAGWMTLHIGEAKKVQGRANLCSLLVQDEDVRAALCKLINIPNFEPRARLIRQRIGYAGTDDSEPDTDTN